MRLIGLFSIHLLSTRQTAEAHHLDSNRKQTLRRDVLRPRQSASVNYQPEPQPKGLAGKEPGDLQACWHVWLYIMWWCSFSCGYLARIVYIASNYPAVVSFLLALRVRIIRLSLPAGVHAFGPMYRGTA